MSDKKRLILPILLITVGVGWLLTAIGVVPAIDWVWTLGLAVIGLLAFAVGGFNKVTVVMGPFFIVASCLSILRQTNRLRSEIELPVLMIVGGVLLLIARMPAIPLPNWVIQESDAASKMRTSDSRQNKSFNPTESRPARRSTPDHLV